VDLAAALMRRAIFEDRRHVHLPCANYPRIERELARARRIRPVGVQNVSK
jgi:hypothetical protein